MEFIQLTQDQLKNKLFCTFSPKDKLEEVLDTIKSEYIIMYGKIFVLESEDSDEFLCTYNIEVQSTSTKVLPNTILLHRKKETNTLYTVNALNEVIRSVNNGILDKTYQLDWTMYQNSFILTDPIGYRVIDLLFFKKISWN